VGLDEGTCVGRTDGLPVGAFVGFPSGRLDGRFARRVTRIVGDPKFVKKVKCKICEK
jgi:hypothetical protein